MKAKIIFLNKPDIKNGKCSINNLNNYFSKVNKPDKKVPLLTVINIRDEDAHILQLTKGALC